MRRTALALATAGLLALAACYERGYGRGTVGEVAGPVRYDVQQRAGHSLRVVVTKPCGGQTGMLTGGWNDAPIALH